MLPVSEEVARVRSLAARTAAAREWPAEQLEAAEHFADRLGRYATAIVDPDGSVPSCGIQGCPLESHPAGPSAIRLAPMLAKAQRGAMESSAHPSGLPPQQLNVLHRRYVSALVDAAAVVYCCRRVLHTSDECFFDAAEGATSGLCGRVLAVAHQIEHPLAG